MTSRVLKELNIPEALPFHVRLQMIMHEIPWLAHTTFEELHEAILTTLREQHELTYPKMSATYMMNSIGRSGRTLPVIAAALDEELLDTGRYDIQNFGVASIANFSNAVIQLRSEEVMESV